MVILRKPYTYADTLAKLLKSTYNYHKQSHKRLENFGYKSMIIPSMRILLADVLARRAIISTPMQIPDMPQGEIVKLANIFSNWEVDKVISCGPITTLHNKYSRELINMRCIPDIVSDKPNKSLRAENNRYSGYFAYFYLTLFYWEAGFVKDEIMAEICSKIFSVRAEGWFGGEVQKTFLGIAKAWCRENFESLKNCEEEKTTIDEDLERIIIKTYFDLDKYDLGDILTAIWGDGDYKEFRAWCEVCFLTELVNICELFVREETGVIERVFHHAEADKLRTKINSAKKESDRLRDELEETRRRARQAEKELAEIKKEAADVKPEIVFKGKINELEEENKRLREEAKAAVLELELNNHKRSRYTEKIRQLENELKKSKAEKEAARNELAEIQKENHELIDCLKELEEDEKEAKSAMSEEDKEIARTCKYTLIIPYFLASHIKKRLPNCRTIISVSDGKFDIGQAEAVFVMVNHLKHSQLYRLTSQAKHYGSSIVHITSSGVNNFVRQVIK